MSLQADVVAYWQGNTTLTNAIPFASFWVGVAPERSAFPYAVMTPLASVPTYVTNGPANGYVEDYSFQVSIFDADPDNALAVAQTVVEQFEGQSISTECMAVFRTNGPVFVVDQDTPSLVYHCWVEFDYQANTN